MFEYFECCTSGVHELVCILDFCAQMINRILCGADHYFSLIRLDLFSISLCIVCHMDFLLSSLMNSKT
jgi:hypothetical protein